MRRAEPRDQRPHMPAPVNALADRIAALLEPELHDADREVVACALLTQQCRPRPDLIHCPGVGTSLGKAGVTIRPKRCIAPPTVRVTRLD
jgi:hypothetical protein